MGPRGPDGQPLGPRGPMGPPGPMGPSGPGRFFQPNRQPGPLGKQFEFVFILLLNDGCVDCRMLLICKLGLIRPIHLIHPAR